MTPRVHSPTSTRHFELKPHRWLNSTCINPVFTVENMEVVLHPLEIVSVALDQLGEKVGDLQAHGAAIADGSMRYLPSSGNELRWVSMLTQT